MTKQLPGESLAENKQYEKLLERLAGNQALKRFLARRKEKVGINQPIINPAGILAEASNPSYFQKKFDEETADVKALLTIASQLQRDGNPLAVEALIRTLETGAPLPGEEEPITAMQTLTFIMPEAEKSLLLLRFVMYQFWKNWERECAPEIFNAFDPLAIYEPARDEKTFMLKPHPDYPKELELKVEGLIGKCLHDRNSIDGPDWSLGAELIQLCLEQIHEPYQEKLRNLTPVGNPAFGYYGIDLMFFGQFADVNFLFVTAEPIKDALKQFNRQEQKKIAFWTIQIPVYYWKYILGNGQPGHFTPLTRHLNDSRGKRMHLVCFPESIVQTQFECGWHSKNTTFGFGLWLGPQNYWKMKDRYYPTEGGIILEKDGDYRNSGPLVLDTFLEYQVK